jgi:hypothetical protein
MQNVLRQIPDVVSGYPLDKLQFSVIVPVERTNLIINPSFETNTTGYTSVDGAALTRTTELQRRGVFSLRVKPGLASTSGIYYTTTALVSGSTYAFSLDVWIRASRKYRIRAFDGARTLVTKKIVGRSGWQRIEVLFTPVTSGAHRLYLEKDDNTDTENFFTDGWQLELCTSGNFYPTTYLDGDQMGLVPNQVPAPYMWNGTPHASTSTRSAQTRAGGRVMRLKDLGFVLLAVIGLGMADIRNVLTPMGITGGGVFQRSVPASRTFTLAGSIPGRTVRDLELSRQNLQNAFRFDSVSVNQPLVLQYEFTDPNCGGYGDINTIVCSYNGGLQGRIENYYQERVGLQFVAAQPYILAEGDRGAILPFGLDVPNANRLVWQDAAGNWSSMGTGISSGFVNEIDTGLDGLVYVAGSFSNAGGVTVSNVASYNTDTGEWKSLGIGANGTVSTVLVGPDGMVYIGGAFTLVDGVANTVRIARWNPTTRTWTPLSTGANGTVSSLTFGIDGRLYASGSFTTIGGVAASGVAAWNGTAWAALGSGIASTVSAGVIKSGPDGNIYVGGNFTTAGGGSANRIAKYNPLTGVWSALGTGMDANVGAIGWGLDGTLYAGGQFTTAGGVASPNAAQWNGVSWSPVGDGFNGTVSWISVDADGLVYFAGQFTTSGSLSFATVSKVAVWNGTGITYTKIIIPTAPAVSGVFIDSFGRKFLAYFANGTATAPGKVVVNHAGNSVAYPTIRFTGPATLYQLTNETTGKSIYFNIALIANEIATLELSPTGISFNSNLRGNILGSILPGSDISEFYLLNGNNTISLLMAITTGATITTAQWNDTYWSIDFS